MTTEEVASIVASIGLPYTYYEFPDGTAIEPPYVAYIYTDSNDMMADNINYTDLRTMVIELYTRNKDLALEKQVRDVLINNELSFRMASAYLNDEHLYITTYTTEVYINA